MLRLHTGSGTGPMRRRLEIGNRGVEIGNGVGHSLRSS